MESQIFRKEIEELARKYDEVNGNIVYEAKPPTIESIQKVEKALEIKLPRDLIEFAKHSEFYGNWLASIGPDYESETHIIKINKYLKEQGNIPISFIAINVGYDDDWDCIDIETYDAIAEDYLITYWSKDVPLKESGLYGSFKDYISKNLACWSGSNY